MVENTDSTKVIIGQKEFRKIFYHLSMASKKQVQKNIQDKDYANKERTILSNKISQLESKPESDAWIKAKLQAPKTAPIIKRKIVVIRRKPENPAKRKEMFEIKKHLEVAKRNYALLKKKGISEEYLKRAKDMILKLEESLENLKRK